LVDENDEEGEEPTKRKKMRPNEEKGMFFISIHK